MIEAALVAAGILLFLAGIYTGLWIQRHSYTDREVAKVVTTEKVVEVEKAVIVQVPTAAPRPANGPALPIMGGNIPKTSVLDPGKEAEAKKQFDLLSSMPE